MEMWATCSRQRRRHITKIFKWFAFVPSKLPFMNLHQSPILSDNTLTATVIHKTFTGDSLASLRYLEKWWSSYESLPNLQRLWKIFKQTIWNLTRLAHRILISLLFLRLLSFLSRSSLVMAKSIVQIKKHISTNH